MLRTGADVDRNQDYPRFVLSVMASSDFAAASSLILIFRVFELNLRFRDPCVRACRSSVFACVHAGMDIIRSS